MTISSRSSGLHVLMAGHPPALIHRVLPHPDQAQPLAASGSVEEDGAGDLDFAELTFSEAFGPIAGAASGEDAEGASPSGPGRYPDAVEDEETQRLQDWAPPGSIPEGRAVRHLPPRAFHGGARAHAPPQLLAGAGASRVGRAQGGPLAPRPGRRGAIAARKPGAAGSAR